MAIVTSVDSRDSRAHGGRLAYVLLSGAALLALSEPAHAQDEAVTANGDAVEEGSDDRYGAIIVTARKREERLEDVPASIAAASGERLDQLNIDSVQDLDAIAPGLTFSSNPNAFVGVAVSIRGVGTQIASSAIQDSVGVVIDNVPIAVTKAGAFPNLSDVARVEVLRGPQGTLFGKNASAGLIQVSTEDPTSDPEFDFSASYGTHRERELYGAASGPISGELLGRFSAFYNANDGYVFNVVDGKAFEEDAQYGARAKLVLDTMDIGRFELNLDYVRQENSGGRQTERAFTNVTPQPIVDLIGDITYEESNLFYAVADGDHRQNTGGGSVEWTYDLDKLSLTSVTAYRTYGQKLFILNTINPTNLNEIFTAYGEGTQNQFSQEVRVNTDAIADLFDLTAGLFYLASSNERQFGNLIQSGGLDLGLNRYSDTETKNFAVFGEANIYATDWLTAFGGARYTHERVDTFIEGLPIPPGQVRISIPLGSIEGHAAVDNVSWRAGLRAEFGDQMIYASASTGYKGPGFNVNIATLGSPQPVAPETSESFEAGLRSEFFDGRLTLFATAYSTTFRDFQTSGRVFPNGPDFPAETILINAPKLRTKGLEFELQALPWEGMSLTGNASYIDARYLDFPNAPCYTGQPVGPGQCSTAGLQDLTGKRMSLSPEWSFNLAAKQDFDLPATEWEAHVSADYSWRSGVQWDLFQNPLQTEDAYGQLGASIGLTNPDETFTVKVFAKNLTNKFHTSGIIYFINRLQHYLPADFERTIGVTVSFTRF